MTSTDTPLLTVPLGSVVGALSDRESVTEDDEDEIELLELAEELV